MHEISSCYSIWQQVINWSYISNNKIIQSLFKGDALYPLSDGEYRGLAMIGIPSQKETKCYLNASFYFVQKYKL